MRVITNLFLVLVCAAVTFAGAKTVPPTPKSSTEKVIDTLFKLLKINDVDVSTCLKDINGADIKFRDFADEVGTNNYTMAVESLGQGISALSSSVSQCGVEEVQHKLDALALAIKWAKISTKGLDSSVKVLVGASDLWKDMEALATAAKSGDSTNIANAIGQLLSEWTQVTGGCGDNKGCQTVDGIIRVIQTVAGDIAPCEEALKPAVASFESAVTSFKANDVKSAVASMADGLDTLAKALTNDSCGLKTIGNLISKLSPKLAGAVIQKIEGSKAVKIIVGSADVYDDVYQAIMALEKGDISGFGMQVGNLLRELRASGCETKACVVLIGLMASIQDEAQDFDACMGDADKAWEHVTYAMADFGNRDGVRGVENLGQAVVVMGQAVSQCDIPGLGKIAEDMFTKLGDNTVANDIGDAVQLLVNGADVTHIVNQAILDFKGENWAGFGQDLGSMASFLTGVGCNSVACKVVEGLLNAAGVAFSDLKACEADLKTAVSGFTYGAQQIGDKKYISGIKSWGAALNTVSKAVADCGIENEFKYLEQEANVLGYGNVSTAMGNDVAILLHGVDFYQELYRAFTDIKNHDYRQAGGDLQGVMDQLSQWTEKHACTSDFCYVVVGVFQFLGDIKGSVKTCESDFKNAWSDFESAVGHFEDSHHSIFHWTHNKEQISDGVKSLGDGMKLVAKGVSDCHIEEFAELLEKLAVKLGIAPEISGIMEILHILINGVNIENEIGDACDDYASKNWVGFGYNVARLVKTLV